MAGNTFCRPTTPTPKRILSLDGGGVRGILSLGLLARIEALLRARFGDRSLKLSDYFDLIGGTSTGAIIASALALGKEVAWVREQYLKLAERVFAEKKSGGGIFRERYDTTALKTALRDVFGDVTLGSEELETGLCIVTKRADTNSTWPFFNHPEGRYFEQNKDMPLRLLVRASAAAPTYFKSETIRGKSTGGRRFEGEFVDGGVSMHNNPALLLFKLATLSGFPFRWRTGVDRLLLVSVGTGFWGVQGSQRRFFKDGIGWGEKLVGMLLEDASWLNQQILQMLSSSPTAYPIDSEMGALEHDLLGGEAHLSYLRYDVPLEGEKLRKLNLVNMPFNVEKVQALDGAGNMEQLDHLGQVAAGRLVHALHFPRAFDLEARKES